MDVNKRVHVGAGAAGAAGAAFSNTGCDLSKFPI